MNIVKRVLNLKNIIIYLCFIVLLIISFNNSSIYEILGGIDSSKNNNILNVTQIIKWNLCVLPPIIISLLFLSEEFGAFRKFTLIRSKNVKEWVLVRFGIVIFINYIYIFLFFIITYFIGINSELDIRDIILLLIVFPIHTVAISMLIETIAVITNSQKNAIISYFFIEGFTVILGLLYPTISKYLISYWGMLENQVFIFSSRIIHICITNLIMVVTIIIVLNILIQFFKKYSEKLNYIK